jgi:lysyl-tRNA synthetase class 1
MNGVIKEVLDNTSEIRKIYEEMYKKELPKNWYPFQAFCPACGKVSTTSVTDWDGRKVSIVCEINKVKWTTGCGYKGKISPFSSKEGITGKLPWKVEWAAKWKVVGITVEGAGKDHMSAGGSHDLASQICERVINYPVPYPLAHEFFLIGGKKMSSSKGLGSSADDMSKILPPQLLRFLMVKTRLNTAINFDASGDTIPNLFDEYQRFADAYFNKGDEDLARVFELSQVGKVQKPPKIRFSVLSQWAQMPNMEAEIKKESLEEWAKYARIWLERFAPEEDKFTIQKELPREVQSFSKEQKRLLEKLAKELGKDWEGEAFQTRIYDIGREMGLDGKQAFAAIYLSLIGKDHGPKAAWLILSLDKEFVKKRFNEASK